MSAMSSSKSGEAKRVTLTTISQSTTSATFTSSGVLNESPGLAAVPAFSRFGDFLAPDAPPAAAAAKNNASKSASNKSIRLKLELFETDSNKYPEFNYSKLVQLEKKKAKKLKLKPSNGPSSDPFAENDDDVARIAKDLEKKYGNAYARGRGRKKDDFCDIGMGYDESDTFIDNSEAYDEVIPEEVETIEGGFYINCGALEFKNLTKKSGTTRTDEIIKMPERPRKRVLSTSSEESSSSDDDEDGDEDDDDDDEEDEEDENESDSESLEDEEDGATAKDKSKYKNAEKRAKTAIASKQKANNAIANANPIKKPSKKLAVSTSSSSNSPRPIALETTSDTEERQAQALKKVVKTTTVKDMLKAKRDSFLKSQGDSAVKGVVNGEVKCTSTDMESSSENGGTDSATEQGAGRVDKQGKSKDNVENLRTADTILPPTLDVEILASINIFKDMVMSRDMCGKKFRFDDKLTPPLLKVYEALLCTERNERNMVFAHLEYQLQLPKYFILRKSKALRSKEEKNKTMFALEKLRKAIVEVMPKAIANYETELRKFAELQAIDVNAEHPPKMPRKKFQWHQELRELLYEVYKARWTSYEVLGKRKDSLVEFINGYLKEKVVELWPTGWMRYEELQREIERHKNANKKAKEKPKKVGVVLDTAAQPLPMALNNYLKQFEELATVQTQSRSCGNSDTDSATSASSNSLKRKQAINNKPPPTKKKAMKQQLSVDPLLTQMPSTSAQAAALTAALDLVSPSKKTDHSIYSIMTAASLAAATASSSSTSTTISQQQQQQLQLGLIHSKMSAAPMPMPHVINLDDYHSPDDILQTSKQLALANNKWPTTQASPVAAASVSVSASQVRRESGSESDGVEIVGVYQAAVTTTPTTKPKVNHKNKTTPSATATSAAVMSPHSPNGLYVYNNNNTSKPNAAMRANAYDLAANQQIMKTLSDLKNLEKQMWPPNYSVAPGNMKGQ